MMREAYCGTRDENEDHEDALFVLVLPPLLALLFAVVKKVKRVSLLVFAFVRILVVAKPLLLVKEVIIIITERERLFQVPRGRTTDQNVVIPYAPPPFVSLERSRTVVTLILLLSLLSLSLASVNYHEYDSLLSLKVFLSEVYYSNDICEGSFTPFFFSLLHSTKHTRKMRYLCF